MEGVDEDAYCTICWVSELGSEPCIRLDCGHVFHLKCLKQIIDKKWSSLRITFAFLDCPSCKQEMKLDHCPMLRDSMSEVLRIKEKITNLAVQRA